MYSLIDYNYDLPEEFIAQEPAGKRDRSRLLSLNRRTGEVSHHLFYEICSFLLPSDVLVVNNTEVIPGRLFGHKDTGGKVEALILDYADKNKEKNKEFVFECLIRASKRPKPGTSFVFDQGLTAEVIASQDEIHTLRFFYDGDFESLLYRIGNMPLPPYIKRSGGVSPCNDRKSYQTVYARQKGAVAAPTAGLHFSEKLLEKIKSMGVNIVEITLHVGYGTFLPVRASDIRDHKIHSEQYYVSKTSAETINHAKAKGGRIVAVGTTCVRSLEFASDNNGNVSYGSGNCNLFIYPGYRFKAVDAMITNFHLPQSTLLMLVSAFAGRKNILAAYSEAIKERYRFYSYGDAMVIM
ncbi:MAG TPA: tRNA preQ1(34) S-adenosylmethionine ribosyltransferase-isomerase QueA [Anaerolineae bacterium]|nr:tRNA preQ1(34) S-adenosylmethionine ribosyltransferase-isomerase QueA [Anaerolineae bacterium]